jgi:hypothetical protein
MIKATYDAENKCLVIPGDFTGRISEIMNTPLIPYKTRADGLESEFISLIPYTVFADESGKRPAQMTYMAGSPEAAAIMVQRINSLFKLSINLGVCVNKQKYDKLCNKV